MLQMMKNVNEYNSLYRFFYWKTEWDFLFCYVTKWMTTVRYWKKRMHCLPRLEIYVFLKIGIPRHDRHHSLFPPHTKYRLSWQTHSTMYIFFFIQCTSYVTEVSLPANKKKYNFVRFYFLDHFKVSEYLQGLKYLSNNIQPELWSNICIEKMFLKN